MINPSPVNFNLQGRRAVVSGSASGIGFATAELLARSGAQVAMNDLAGATLERAVERFVRQGFSVHEVAGDLERSKGRAAKRPAISPRAPIYQAIRKGITDLP